MTANADENSVNVHSLSARSRGALVNHADARGLLTSVVNRDATTLVSR